MFLFKYADVPRGTNTTMRVISLLFISLFLFACNKPLSNPELSDPIYSDLSSMLASTTQAIVAEKATLMGHEKALQEVVPQSGQIKYAEKRVKESKERINRLEQERLYLELKLNNRKRVSQSSYAKAFEKGEPWPNPKEWESYLLEKKFRSAKKDWDVRERMKELGFDHKKTPEPTKSGGH